MNNPEAKTPLATKASQSNLKDVEKVNRNEKEAGSREDWEGGASRPMDAIVPEEKLPNSSSAKNLQAQAESVPKTPSGDNGPPENLQSLPTQDTHTVSPEQEVENKPKRQRLPF